MFSQGCADKSRRAERIFLRTATLPPIYLPTCVYFLMMELRNFQKWALKSRCILQCVKLPTASTASRRNNRLGGRERQRKKSGVDRSDGDPARCAAPRWDSHVDVNRVVAAPDFIFTGRKTQTSPPKSGNFCHEAPVCSDVQWSLNAPWDP